MSNGAVGEGQGNTTGGTQGGAGGATGGAAGGASGGVGTGVGVAGAGAGSQAPWYGSFQNAELRTYVESKGFKDAETALDSYRNLEKLQGVPAERLLKLPEKADDKDGWSKIHRALGVPEKMEDYTLPVPKDSKPDEGFQKWARELFHKNNLTKDQVKAVVEGWNEYQLAAMNSHKAATEEGMRTQLTDLKKEWGMAFDQNLDLADKAAEKLGIDEATLNQLKSVMGIAKLGKFMHGIGTKMLEPDFVTSFQGTGGGFGKIMSPQAAEMRIRSLRQDPDFTAKLAAGNADARAEMDRLHEMAYPTERVG